MINEVEGLFRRQMKAWPQLVSGVEGLTRASTRRVRIDWYDIFVRHIPHRMSSTSAPIDRESIARRPCFLCTANLPLEEEGVRFGEDFTIYCNPFPIVDCHLTIAHRVHSAQQLNGRFGAMLDLAAALPGYFIIYNGPECGASAPDHMHFQAGLRSLFPIEKETAGLRSMTASRYARNVLIFRERDRSVLIDRMHRAVDLLGQVTGQKREPMLNLALFHERGQWVAYLFPRGKHRPDAFYTGELTVSPASIDLCSILVVPLVRDFEKITGEAIAAIFREVTLSTAQFNEVAAKLESWP